jgi:hypothetical protein
MGDGKELMIVELAELGFSTRDPGAMTAALMIYATDATYEAHMTTRDSNETRVVYAFNRRGLAGFAMTCVYVKRRERKRARLALA